MVDLAIHIKRHEFRNLFIDDLGWDAADGAVTAMIDGQTCTISTIARKSGLQILHCPVDRLMIADAERLHRIQRLLPAVAREYIAIYSNEEPPRQVWQWEVRLSRGRVRHCGRPFLSKAPPPALLERLGGLAFAGDEQHSQAVIDAVQDVRAALAVRMLNVPARHRLRARTRQAQARGIDRLARRMARGDRDALERIVILHRPLVRRLARRFSRLPGIERDDAEQIGMLALLRAAARFNPDRGVTFATYAHWWISRSYERSASAGLPVRIPIKLLRRCRDVRQEIERLSSSGPECVRGFLDEFRRAQPGLAADWSRFGRAMIRRSLSDARPSAPADRRWLSDGSEGPLESAIRSERIQAVRAALSRLHKRDARIVSLHFGIDGPPLSLAQIGRMMNLSRERVRQLQARAESRVRDVLHAAVPTLAECYCERGEQDQDGNAQADE